MAAARLLLLLLFLIAPLHLLVESRSALPSQMETSSAARLRGRSLLDDTASAAAIDCGKACAERCKKASRHNLCLRACGTCCARCNCVPPGTYGNYEACSCYATLTTHGGRRKCP